MEPCGKVPHIKHEGPERFPKKVKYQRKVPDTGLRYRFHIKVQRFLTKVPHLGLRAPHQASSYKVNIEVPCSG